MRKEKKLAFAKTINPFLYLDAQGVAIDASTVHLIECIVSVSRVLKLHESVTIVCANVMCVRESLPITQK